MAVKIDRTKQPPLLLKVSYTKNGNFNRTATFEGGRDKPDHEVNIYTWKDATLKELLRDILLQTSDQEIAYNNTEYIFGAVFPHLFGKNAGRYEIRRIGRLTQGRDSKDDKIRPLEDKRYIVGDRLDIAIVLPRHMPREKSPSQLSSKSSSSRGRSRSPIRNRNRSDSESSLSSKGSRPDDNIGPKLKQESAADDQDRLASSKNNSPARDPIQESGNNETELPASQQDE